MRDIFEFDHDHIDLIYIYILTTYLSNITISRAIRSSSVSLSPAVRSIPNTNQIHILLHFWTYLELLLLLPQALTELRIVRSQPVHLALREVDFSGELRIAMSERRELRERLLLLRCQPEESGA